MPGVTIEINFPTGPDGLTEEAKKLLRELVQLLAHHQAKVIVNAEETPETAPQKLENNIEQVVKSESGASELRRFLNQAEKLTHPQKLLLELLSRPLGKVVAYKEITDHLWPGNSAPASASNAISVYRGQASAVAKPYGLEVRSVRGKGLSLIKV